MGLPKGSLPALYLALQGKGSYTTVKGLTPAIKAAVQQPWQTAFVNAGSTVFLVSAAFSGTAIILACFFQNNDISTQNYVASNVHGKQAEKKYTEELKEERRASVASATQN